MDEGAGVLRSETALRAVLEGLPDATVAAGRDGRIVLVNDRALELFGYAREELVGRPIQTLWPERLRERYTRNMDLYFATEHPLRFTLEARGVRRDGSEFVGEMSWGIVETGEGPLLLAIGRDVSARREAEARVRRQSGQQAAVAALGEGALAGRDVASLAREAVERMRETLPVDRVVVTQAGAGGVLAEWGAGRGMAGVLEVEMRAAGQVFGTLLVQASRESAFSEDERSFITAIAHVIATAMERLRHEDQLRHAQKMEAVGQLAGGIAHDFNNLLTVISGYAEIARRAIGSGRGAQELTEIHHAAARAAQVTRQLLAFSRRQVLEPVVLDLNEVTASLGPMLSRLIGEHIEIAIHHDDGVAPVVADRGQLTQVILNLAVNARDAMPAGGVLTIATRMVDVDETTARRQLGVVPGRYVGLIVSDTGSGMEPQVLEHAFEPFFTTKAAGEGTGLGLATVQGIASQSGGHVSVESEPERGSTFTVCLPPAEPTPAAAPPPADARPDRLSGTETVLVCEDEDGVRQLIELILTDRGYRLLLAARPSHALRLAADHPGRIDVLLSDVIMPEMLGPELAERLRELRPGLRTLFVSGYTAEALHTRGDLPPGSTLLEKPFESTTLLEALRRLLDRP